MDEGEAKTSEVDGGGGTTFRVKSPFISDVLVSVFRLWSLLILPGYLMSYLSDLCKTST